MRSSLPGFYTSYRPSLNVVNFYEKQMLGSLQSSQVGQPFQDPKAVGLMRPSLSGLFDADSSYESLRTL